MRRNQWDSEAPRKFAVEYIGVKPTTNDRLLVDRLLKEIVNRAPSNARTELVLEQRGDQIRGHLMVRSYFGPFESRFEHHDLTEVMTELCTDVLALIKSWKMTRFDGPVAVGTSA